MFSESFNIGRRVVQGDIISPVLFILTLDELIQQHDKVTGKGYICGRILRLNVLGYADDVARSAHWGKHIRNDKTLNFNFECITE